MTTTKTGYVHARLPGRELVHLVPAEGLVRDTRFGHEGKLRGEARTVCGKRSDLWITRGDGRPCRWCEARG